ncbi:MAG: TonB-dependent receptor, partial [Amphiplicatus sp.]|nr:TonB-dependent receptor [Amphiplicatus sp.]
MRNILFCAASLAPIVLSCTPASADDAGDRDEIIVTDSRRDALAEAKAYAESRPGNVDLVPIEEYSQRYAVSLRDALAFTPGAVMQTSFGEDGRLSVRGSGLTQNYHLRGVELILNGVPINAADGFGDFQEMDLLFASHINVLKGSNAFRTGSSSLGGAIEIEGASAKSVDDRFFLRAEGGSFGTSRLHGHVAKDFGKFDALVAGTWQRQDGFRDHAQQRNERLYANFGYDWSDSVETRFGVYLNGIDQEIAGSVSLAQALTNPQGAGAMNISLDQQRDMNTQRAFTTTRFDLGGAGAITIGGSFAHKDLYHPIPIFLLQQSEDYTGFAKYEGAAELGSIPLTWDIGMRYRFTDLDSQVYGNFGGAQGPLFSSSNQQSSRLETYGELRAGVAPGLEAIAGLTYVRTVRDFDDLLNDAEDDRLVFKEPSPRFGLLWRPTQTLQLFANVSASYEPPTFGDLTQSGVAGFTPIKAQDGLTYEFGGRGTLGALSFEAAFFHADLDGEFVAFTVTPNVPAPIFNADDTVHQGVELYARLALVDDWNGVSIKPRIAYTWNDFHFVNDATFGDNRLAGMPTHIGRAEVEFLSGGFRLAPNVIFQTGDNFVDYANTLQSPGHALVGIEASYALRPGVEVFVD